MQHTTQFSRSGYGAAPVWREPAEFGAASVSTTHAQATEPDFTLIAESEEFRELRGRLRRFVFPMTALFLAWYLTYVLVADYEPGFMGVRVLGTINVGLLMGLGQFLSTIVITALYVRYAARRVDPLVAEIRRAAKDGEFS